MTDTQAHSASEELPEPEGEASPTRRVVGVLADPDRPAEIAQSLAKDSRLAGMLARRLDEELGEPVEWDVQVRVNAVAVDVRELPDVFDAADRERDEQGWDWVVYLTDLPIRAVHGPVLADLCLRRGVAALSLPALGGFALQRRAAMLMVRLVARLCGASDRCDDAPGVGGRVRRWAASAFAAPVHSTDAPDLDVDERLIMPPWRGRARLMAGMVRTNHPGRLLVGMPPAFAATVAASAFMIFNTSTWQIATTASPLRLGTAVCVGMALLLAWIIVRHGLWERRRDEPGRELRWLYNLATLATIGQGVIVLTAVTFLIDLGAVLFLLSPTALAHSPEARPRRHRLVHHRHPRHGRRDARGRRRCRPATRTGPAQRRLRLPAARTPATSTRPPATELGRRSGLTRSHAHARRPTTSLGRALAHSGSLARAHARVIGQIAAADPRDSRSRPTTPPAPPARPLRVGRRPSVAALDELVIGPDDCGETIPTEAALVGARDAAVVARLIAEQVRHPGRPATDAELTAAGFDPAPARVARERSATLAARWCPPRQEPETPEEEIEEEPGYPF